MKHFLFFLIISIFVLSANTAYAEIVMEVDYEKNTAMIYESGIPIAKHSIGNAAFLTVTGSIPNGEVKKYEKDGYTVYTYNNNFPHGDFRSYYTSGILKQEGKFRKGKRDGILKQYYENGKIKAEWHFKKGKQHGPCKKYYENKNLKAEWMYKDNRIDGIHTKYYEDGTIESEWRYRKGKRDGKCFVYDVDGKLKYTEIYKNDKKIEHVLSS
ncbi:MAG: toxin-antitoxin system YwqK family antitoxin [Candidatus Omnitrophica bacterium]|nr:toxin-antitoxin system YwqK family antitoxin [Candidatus Omnitrophota bacterium]